MRVAAPKGGHFGKSDFGKPRPNAPGQGGGRSGWAVGGPCTLAPPITPAPLGLASLGRGRAANRSVFEGRDIHLPVLLPPGTAWAGPGEGVGRTEGLGAISEKYETLGPGPGWAGEKKFRLKGVSTQNGLFEGPKTGRGTAEEVIFRSDMDAPTVWEALEQEKMKKMPARPARLRRAR